MEGTHLGPYAVERKLGSGGMGRVFAARVTRPVDGLHEGDLVALKVVHEHLLETPGFFKRFLREAEIGQAVSHPNVVRTLDCDAVGSTHFLVMEHVEGQTLAQLQRDLVRVPEELCRHIATEICRGLAAIHSVGAVHRDLKPDNILITPDHVVKVMDLGVARLVDERLRLSQTGAFVGSAEYAAPEQFGGGNLDARCDLHALGVTLYELVTGVHPFRADDFERVMRRVCDERPRAVIDLVPDVTPFFDRFVETLTAKRREHRFESAEAVLSAIEGGEASAWWRSRVVSEQAAGRRQERRLRIPRATGVFGREAEIERLCALFEDAKAAQGRVLLLEGEAGIGKSRLVDESIRRLRDAGEHLNFLFGSYPPGGLATVSGAFASALREHVGAGRVDHYLVDTPLLAPAFEAFLRGDAPPVGAMPLTNDTLATCFIQALRTLSEERPTVVLIDDLHFAPEEARALFTALALTVPRQRLLLVGTFRPGLPDEWISNLSRHEHVARLGVDRLGPKDLVRLLQESLRSEHLARRLGVQIALKSDGNPFFAFEIVRGLREGGLLRQSEDGSWVSTGAIDDIEIPSSVLDLVNARVAGLDEGERLLLDVAACWGYEFDPLLIGDAIGRPRIATLRSLAQIERRHRLVRGAGRTMTFDHHQVQEALYGSLLEPLREEYHGALADALMARTGAADADPDELDGEVCVALCDQLLRADRGPSAARYLKRAQLHLDHTFLPVELIQLSERALAAEGVVDGRPRASALLRLARALNLTGRRERQREVVLEAAALAADSGDRHAQMDAANAIGNLHFRTAQYEEMEAAFRDQLEVARELGDRHSEASALGGIGLAHQARGNIESAREHYARSLAIWEVEGGAVNVAIALTWLGNTYSLEGRLPDAAESFARALALNREAGHRVGESTATANLAIVHGARGRIDEALAHHERALTIAREVGYRHGQAVALFNLASVLRGRGEWDRAQECASNSILLTEEIVHPHLGAAARITLGAVRSCRGDVDAGRADLRRAASTAADGGFAEIETLALCELAALPDGDVGAALAAYERNEERLTEGDRRECRLLLWRATRAREHLVEAKRLVDVALSKASPEDHEAMLANLRILRSVMTEWRAEFEPGGGESGSEAVTRVG